MDNNNLNNISNDLYMLLLSLNKRIFNHEEMLKNCNLPPSHVKALFYLIHNGPRAISQIGNDLSISKPNMTPIIDKLVSEGLINRFQDPNDRRVIRIQATEAACNFLKEREQRVKSNLIKKISPLSDDDLKELEESVKKMQKILLKI